MGALSSILVVDDDRSVIASLFRVLSRRWRVETAYDAESAVRTAKFNPPDLAIIDLVLGSESGLNVVRTLAQNPTTFVVMMSGYLSTDITVAAVHAGARVVVPKPVGAMEIVRRLEIGSFEEAPAISTPTLAAAEREHIDRVLTDCAGNLAEAARRLGIYRSTLQRKLKKRPV